MEKKAIVGNGIVIVGIDPGLTGALVRLNAREALFFKMPVYGEGKKLEIDPDGFLETLKICLPFDFIYLERAIPIAMGSKAAFNYGRGFSVLEQTIRLMRAPVVYVEPQKWAKVMHEGISSDLKPKAKSLVAVNRLYPELLPGISAGPKSKKLHEGMVDALLIAGYGQRQLLSSRNPNGFSDLY